MYEAILFFVVGFEEIEAVATLDILRRGGVNAVSVSLTGVREVKGSRGITVVADMIFDDLRDHAYAMLILPGGPGTENYKNHELFLELLRLHHSKGYRLAAICAAPTIFGMLGFLTDKTCVCYPTCEPNLNAAKIGSTAVVTDGNITTSRGPATTIDFALELVRIIKGDPEAAAIAEGILA
jgi:4-methyl-5(b-hydroxyethyl)-thiazole monophosphate biosynthesis